MAEKEFETVQEAAARTGRTADAVRNWVKRGRVTYTKEEYGRKLLAVADVDAYLATAREGRPSKRDDSRGGSL